MATTSTTSTLAANESQEISNVTAPSHQPLPPNELYPLVAILAVFSVTGTVGNAVAFYVFSTLKKQKLTSTIFILALAGTDFITCLITIPFTITMELLDFKVQVDFFCKFYHFLITTTVPFSAFVMVVIAVDRYLCICHPFLHWMTQRRAKIIIACLSLFIFCIGGIICLHYSIYQESQEELDIFADLSASSLSPLSGFEGFPNATAAATYRTNFTFAPRLRLGSGSRLGNVTLVTLTAAGGGGGGGGGVGRRVPGKMLQTVMMKKQCDRRENTIDVNFFNAMQRIYSGFFLVSCVAVFILYSLIYHSVVTQRRKKLKIRSANCCFLWSGVSSASGLANGKPSEVTAALELTHVSGENGKTEVTARGNENANTTTATQAATTTTTTVAASSNGASVRAPLTRTRLERMRLANIKTALMLFVVTLVFIFSFLPSWLIALKIIRASVMVFYMYFVYNVVNPIIYAFMNQNFRTELKKLFRCQH